MIHAFKGSSQPRESLDVTSDREAICGIDVHSYKTA